MRIIGGAIGPVIAGAFISLYVAEVPADYGRTTTVPNDMALTQFFFSWCHFFVIDDTINGNYETKSIENGNARNRYLKEEA